MNKAARNRLMVFPIRGSLASKEPLSIIPPPKIMLKIITQVKIIEFLTTFSSAFKVIVSGKLITPAQGTLCPA